MENTFLPRKVKETIAIIASVLIDYIHSPHEEISAVISTLKKLDEIPFPSSPPGEKHDRAEKLWEARLFAGMEMTVDFDLTRWNLIILRTGTCSSGTRNEACRRSRVDDDDDDGDVKVRYEIHRQSFSSEGSPKERYPYFCLISSLTFDYRHDTSTSAGSRYPRQWA